MIENRDILIDIMKGIAIICIVAGHTFAPFTEFIYLFHVAFFFITSGYFYKIESSDSISNLIKFIKRKILSLYIPYLFWNCIFILCHNFFICFNIYTTEKTISLYTHGQFNNITKIFTYRDILKNILKSILMIGGTQVGGALWFLTTLFVILVFYVIIDYFIKNHMRKTYIIQAIFSLFILIIAFLIKKIYVNSATIYIGRILSCYSLVHIGVLIKKYKCIILKNKGMIIHVYSFLVSFIVLAICNKIGKIEIGRNEYTNPIFFIIVSVTGWFFIYEIAFLFNNIKCLKKILTLVGQNTIPIIIFHFLCFKIDNYIGVVINKEPHFLIAAFPVLYKDGLWWLAYTTIGVIIPVFMGIFYKKYQSRLTFAS